MTNPQTRLSPDSWPEHWKQTGYNGCLLQAANALKYLANNERPFEGEALFNSAHLLQLANELGKTKDVLLAPRVASNPAEETMTLSQIWQAAGGNPGITPTRQDVLLALKTLDEICDEADLPAAPTVSPISSEPVLLTMAANVLSAAECGSLARWASAINAWAEAGGNTATGPIADAVNELADCWWHDGAPSRVKAVHQASAALKQVLNG